MLTREYLYAYAAASVSDGVLDTLILPTANTECMQIFLDEVEHENIAKGGILLQPPK